jgi:hypothetical protein
MSYFEKGCLAKKRKRKQLTTAHEVVGEAVQSRPYIYSCQFETC